MSANCQVGCVWSLNDIIREFTVAVKAARRTRPSPQRPHSRQLQSAMTVGKASARQPSNICFRRAKRGSAAMNVLFMFYNGQPNGPSWLKVALA